MGLWGSVKTTVFGAGSNAEEVCNRKPRSSFATAMWQRQEFNFWRWKRLGKRLKVVILQKASPLLLIGKDHDSGRFTGGLNERFRYVGHGLFGHRFDSFLAFGRQVADGVWALVQLYDCLREHYCSIGTTRC